jgi:hypothetical protein
MMPTTSPTRRRWFQFGLGTMFVVVTITGVFFWWLGLEWKYVRDRHAYDVQASGENARGGYPGYALPADLSLSPGSEDPMSESDRLHRWPPTVPYWRRWLGDEPRGLVMVPSAWSREEAESVAALFPEGFVFWNNERMNPDWGPPATQ